MLRSPRTLPPVRSVLLALLLAIPASLAGQTTTGRVPADDWMRYANAEEAGFDPVKLEAAR
ncbi:MAG: hypothetical protein P8049_11640, partial [Gemmatimonadota bacterium]